MYIFRAVSLRLGCAETTTQHTANCEREEICVNIYFLNISFVYIMHVFILRSPTCTYIYVYL